MTPDYAAILADLQENMIMISRELGLIDELTEKLQSKKAILKNSQEELSRAFHSLQKVENIEQALTLDELVFDSLTPQQ